ncbi:MAG: nucleoside hydrolase [Coriobacteriales bacterium]|jgi:purine nucleosidase
MGKRVIVDFDNTLGVRGCDVDDGLALLYLLGRGDVQIEGICTSYGNSDIETVTNNTRRMLSEWGLDIPVHKGCAGPVRFGDGDVRGAGAFIASTLQDAPGEVSVLVTGSTSNLLQASIAKPGVLNTAASIDFMGGITHTLVINGTIMDELNLSCDPDASIEALSALCSVSVATAQNCLPAFFTRDDLAQLGEDSWVYRACAYWFEDMEKRYKWKGWTCWDVVAAAHLAEPGLFEEEEHWLVRDRRMLSVGFLEEADEGEPVMHVNLPRIKDPDAFKEHVLSMWKAGSEKLGL